MSLCAWTVWTVKATAIFTLVLWMTEYLSLVLQYLQLPDGHPILVKWITYVPASVVGVLLSNRFLLLPASAPPATVNSLSNWADRPIQLLPHAAGAQ